MLPLMMHLYVSRLGDAGKPLHPRIDSEMARHLGYVNSALQGREFFIGDALSGADIQMSFVGDMAKVFDRIGPYPNLARMAGADACAAGVPAQRGEGRGVPVCEVTPTSSRARSVRSDPDPGPSVECATGAAALRAPAREGHARCAASGTTETLASHHILHKYRAAAASAWPVRARYANRRTPLSTATHDRPPASKSLRRWRYFAHEPSRQPRPEPLPRPTRSSPPRLPRPIRRSPPRSAANSAASAMRSS